MKLVITMSRRFGTGASIIAKELSERLDIPVYDKAYIEEQIHDHMYESEAEAIRKLAEKPCIILGRCASDILKDRMNVLNIFVCADKEDRIHRIMDKDDLSYDDAKEKVERTDEEQIHDHMYESEAEAIRKLAEKPCIILGRCASDILKDRMNVLNIFVCADKEDRIHRIMDKDDLSYDDAKEKVERTDEERASYYYEHTGKTWGDVNDYHMIMDTSELGVENCADILMHYFEKLEYI